MADDLKRVGLVFKEDGAVDFRKSLQEVNIEMNKNYNQFKLTQSQWDNSTKSTEKLKAQQEYLTNAIEIQSDKVSVLRRQLEEMENAENKDTTAIKKKQNELTNAEIKLKNYEKQLSNVNKKLSDFGEKMIDAGEKIQKAGSKIESVGKKISVFSTATAGAFIASAKSAIDFEDAFAGVEKTVDGTEEQMEELKQGIRDMAKEIPSTTTEISAVAEAAGQLGIKTEDILSFTRVMIDLGNSTNLSAEEVASSLAKFANITKMSADDYSKLGSVIVDLGNNFATTEADIIDMATKLASTGELTGLTEAQIMALATAMSSVGIEAEAGGSAMSKLLKKIQVAVETGSEDLKEFASVAGMTSDEFKQAFEEDAVKALSAFVGGLNDTERNGKSAIGILDDMEITEIRLSNTVLALASNSELLNDAVDRANNAWDENSALTNESNKRYDTLKSKLVTVVNQLKDCAITIGDKLMPYVEKAVTWIGNLTEKFSNFDDKTIDTIVKIGAIVVAVGPLITILGKLTSTVGGTMKTIGTVTQAVGVMRGTVTTTSATVNGLATVFSTVSKTVKVLPSLFSAVFTAITSPIGIAVIAIGAIVIAIKLLWDHCEGFRNAVILIWETIKKAFLTAKDFIVEKIQELINFIVSIPEKIIEIKDTIVGIVTSFLENLTEKFGGTIESVEAIFSSLHDFLFAIWNTIKTVIESVILLICDLITGDFTQLKEDAINIWNLLKEQVTAIIQAFKETISNIFTAIKTFLIELWNATKDGIVNIITNIKERAIEIFENMKNIISGKITAIKDTIVTGFQSAVEYITSLPGQALTWGRDIIGNIVQGIKDKINDVKNAASEVAQNIRDRLGFSEPKLGPLSDFHTYMPDMIKLMCQGINENKSKLINATENIADDIKNNLSNIDCDENIVVSTNSNGYLSQETGMDYNKLSTTLTNAFLTALNKCKLTLDEDGFARIVKDELYKVV